MPHCSAVLVIATFGYLAKFTCPYRLPMPSSNRSATRISSAPSPHTSATQRRLPTVELEKNPRISLANWAFCGVSSCCESRGEALSLCLKKSTLTNEVERRSNVKVDSSAAVFWKRFVTAATTARVRRGKGAGCAAIV
jgi:hypothetical protein